MNDSGARCAAANRRNGKAAAALMLALALGVIGGRAWGAVAGASALPAASGIPASAPIMVGPRQVFNIDALPGQTAVERAAAINRRIASFVSHPERIVPVVVQPSGRERLLTVADRDILTVTPQDAADNLTTVPDLADSWRRELDQALSTVKAEHQTFWIQIRDSIVLSAEDLLRQAAAFIPRLISALVVLLVVFFAARGARTGVRQVMRETHLDLNTQQLVRTLTYYGIWVVGWLVALGTAGIKPTTLVAGLGVTTIALGFALKDLLSNFVSGFLILTTRPFSLGDQIAVTQYEGTVERIELRATHLRTSDNRLIIIPNADLYVATITNNTASPYRRQEFIVGVDYAADLNQAMALAQRTTQETPGVLPDPPADVLVDELASSSVNLKIRFHTDSRRGNATTVTSQVKQRVKEAFAAAGIAIYPSGTQVVKLQEDHEPAPGCDTGPAKTNSRQPAEPSGNGEGSAQSPAASAARNAPAPADGEPGAPPAEPVEPSRPEAPR